jgi:hypothetical protein
MLAQEKRLNSISRNFSISNNQLYIISQQFYILILLPADDDALAGHWAYADDGDIQEV